MELNSGMIPIVESPKDYQAFCISPRNTNRLAIVFEPTKDNVFFTYCIENFDLGERHRLTATPMRQKYFLF